MLNLLYKRCMGRYLAGVDGVGTGSIQIGYQHAQTAAAATQKVADKTGIDQEVNKDDVQTKEAAQAVAALVHDESQIFGTKSPQFQQANDILSKLQTGGKLSQADLTFLKTATQELGQKLVTLAASNQQLQAGQPAEVRTAIVADQAGPAIAAVQQRLDACEQGVTNAFKAGGRHYDTMAQARNDAISTARAVNDQLQPVIADLSTKYQQAMAGGRPDEAAALDSQRQQLLAVSQRGDNLAVRAASLEIQVVTAARNEAVRFHSLVDMKMVLQNAQSLIEPKQNQLTNTSDQQAEDKLKGEIDGVRKLTIQALTRELNNFGSENSSGRVTLQNGATREAYDFLQNQIKKLAALDGKDPQQTIDTLRGLDEGMLKNLEKRFNLGTISKRELDALGDIKQGSNDLAVSCQRAQTAYDSTISTLQDIKAKGLAGDVQDLTSMGHLDKATADKTHAFLQALPEADRPNVMMALRSLASLNKLDGNVIDQLAALRDPAKTPLAPIHVPAGQDLRRELFMNAINDLAHPGGINQGAWGTCAATRVQTDLALQNPARYVQLVRALASPDAGAAAKIVPGLRRPSDQNLASPDQRSSQDGTAVVGQGERTLTVRLLSPAFMNLATENHYSDKLDSTENKGDANAAVGQPYRQGGGLDSDESERLSYSVLQLDAPYVGVEGGGKNRADVLQQLNDAAGNGLVGVSLQWGAGAHAVNYVGQQVDPADGKAYALLVNPQGELDRMPYEDFAKRLNGAFIAPPPPLSLPGSGQAPSPPSQPIPRPVGAEHIDNFKKIPEMEYKTSTELLAGMKLPPKLQAFAQRNLADLNSLDLNNLKQIAAYGPLDDSTLLRWQGAIHKHQPVSGDIIQTMMARIKST